jgi:arylsulfatase A-like enzyme
MKIDFKMKLIPSLFFFLVSTLPNAGKVPNFIIIYADDLGYTQTSVPMMKDRLELGHSLHQTPHLEKLAARGMRFSNAYCPSPVCTPSRASIQFGMTTARVGCISIHDVVMNKRKVDFKKNLSLAEMLTESKKGYHSAFFGKGCSPLGWFKDHGYDETDFIHKHPNGNGHGDWWEPAEKTLIPLDDPKRVFSLARNSIGYLERRASDKKPFFLTISHYALHVRNMSLKSTRRKYLDIVAEREGIEEEIPDISKFDDNADEMPVKLRSHWERANYAAMMEDMDTSIGMVLDKLKELDMEENTYVIFSSDNGGGASNKPLQGGKARMWEGGIRVPMIVAGPEVPANSQCDVPVAQWDYLSTMHDLSGSSAPLPENLDGVSLRPVFEKGNKGKLAKRDTGFVFHFPAFYTIPITSYRDGDFKLMRHLNTGETKLFNVAKDMGETNELSKSMPEKKAVMIRKLDAYLKKVGAWTMEEVYETRFEELDKWISENKKKVSECKEQLRENPKDKSHRDRLKKAKDSLAKLLKNRSLVKVNQASSKWK